MAPEVIACDEQPDATYDNRVWIIIIVIVIYYYYYYLLLLLFIYLFSSSLFKIVTDSCSVIHLFEVYKYYFKLPVTNVGD